MRWRPGPLAIVALSMTACMGCEGPSGLSGTLPLPSPIAHPNEPAGFNMTAAMERKFVSRDEDGWKDGLNSVFAEDPSLPAPFGPNYVHYEYFEGSRAKANGNSTRLLSGIPSNGGESYMHIVVMFDPGWITEFSILKSIAPPFGGAALSPWLLRFQGRGDTGINTRIVFQGSQSTCPASLNDNQPGVPAIRGGEWFHIEVLVRPNDPGMDNGMLKWWKYPHGSEPVLAGHWEKGVAWPGGRCDPGVFVTDESSRSIRKLKISGINGGKGCCLSKDMWVRYAYFYTSVR